VQDRTPQSPWRADTGRLRRSTAPAWRRKALSRIAVLALSLLLVGTAAACYSLPAPQGWATPVAQGTTVYYTPTSGKLEAYDTAARRVLWDFPGAQSKNVKLQAIYSTPVLSGQSLYFAGYDGVVYALDRSNGQVQWQFNTGASVIGSVLVQNDVLYVGNSDGQIYALNASNGSKLWQDQAGRRVWSSPVAASGLIIVTSMDSDVYAFHPDGGLAWKSHAASAAIADTPDVTPTQINFGAFDKRFHALDPKTGAPIWTTEPAGSWFWTQGLLSGDNLYAGNLDGHIYAYNAGNGSLEWQTDLGAPIRANPALSAGTLVVATRDGSIYGLDPSNGSRRWGPVSAGAEVLANLVPSQDNSVYAVTQPGTKNTARLLTINASSGSSSPVVAP
jgi:outer membrane protein assembly factor BamB